MLQTLFVLVVPLQKGASGEQSESATQVDPTPPQMFGVPLLQAMLLPF